MSEHSVFYVQYFDAKIHSRIQQSPLLQLLTTQIWSLLKKAAYWAFACNIALDTFDEADREEGSDNGKAKRKIV